MYLFGLSCSVIGCDYNRGGLAHFGDTCYINEGGGGCDVSAVRGVRSTGVQQVRWSIVTTTLSPAD